MGGRHNNQGPGFNTFRRYPKPYLFATYFDSNELLLQSDINTLLKKESLLESIYGLRVGYKQKKGILLRYL